MPTTPATGATRRSIQGSLGEKLKEVTDLVNALNVEIFMLDEQRETVEAERDRWRAAFEALHARLQRDLPGDGSELPPPDDAFWAAQLDGLATFAAGLYRETEGSAWRRRMRRVRFRRCCRITGARSRQAADG